MNPALLVVALAFGAVAVAVLVLANILVLARITRAVLEHSTASSTLPAFWSIQARAFFWNHQ